MSPRGLRWARSNPPSARCRQTRAVRTHAIREWGPMHVDRRKRRRARTSVFVVAVLAAGSLFVDAAPTAHADSIVMETVLYKAKDNPNTPNYNELNVRVANPFDPACDRIPGILRGGKVWVDTYVSSSLGRYNG